MTKDTANRPVSKVRVGSVTASIWRNSNDKGTFYSVSFERRYKDKEGNWQTGQSYGPGDLLELAKASDLAHTRILELLQDQAEEAAA